VGGNLVAEIRNSYGIKKEFDKREDYYRCYMLRPLSFYLTPIFIRAGISANVVTFLGFIVGIISLILFCEGKFVMGAILFNVSYLLDLIDGNIARYYKFTNHFGKFIDGITGVIILQFLFLSLGIGVYNSPGGSLFLYFDKSLILIMGSVTSILSLYIIYLHLRYTNALQQIPSEQQEGFQEKIKTEKTPLIIIILRKISDWLMRIDSNAYAFPFIIAALMGIMDFLVIFYLILKISIAFIQTTQILYKARLQLNFYRPY